jgi:hypothetical protein
MGAFTLQVRSEANQARGGGQCRGECALPPVEISLLSLFLVISSVVSSFFPLCPSFSSVLISLLQGSLAIGWLECCLNI